MSESGKGPGAKSGAFASPAGEVESWNTARELLKRLGRITPAFAITIRSLMADGNLSSPAIRAGSHFLLLRLLKSPSMKAILYYASLTFHNEKISNAVYLSSSDLIRLYGPHEIAGLVGLTYLFRRLRTEADLSERLEWPYFYSSLLPRLDLGFHVGVAIPQIGAGKAVLAAALPRLAQGAFFMKNAQKCPDYRRHLEASGRLVDGAYELEHFGCTALDVAACMAQAMGFGARWTHGLRVAQSDNPPSSEEADRDGFDFFMTEKWIQALLKTGAEPAEKLPGRYYPLQRDSYKLMYECNLVRESGSKHTWLSRGKADISAKATPQLYQEWLSELQQPEQVKEFIKTSLPEDIVGALSPEDLSALATGENPEESIE